MSIKIEKNIPLPTNGKSGGSVYPLKEMSVGDSFVTQNVFARNRIYTYAKQCGIKITVRREGKKLRVWRIK